MIINNKENLFDLIKEAEDKFSETGKPVLDIEEFTAEYLDSKGVKVLPCEPGQKLYYLDMTARTVTPKIVEEIRFTKKTIVISFSGYEYPISLIGKWLFLKQKDAEETLEKLIKKTKDWLDKLPK